MTQQERKELLELYKDLRVSDVRDGMDWCGMQHYGSMTTDVRPLFRTHAVGISRTARYLPYQGPNIDIRGDEYTAWVKEYYKNICHYPWNDVEDGDFIVIDASGVNSGLLGSANSLVGISKGARGFVTNGAVRDTDELILEKVPVWTKTITQCMVQVRLKLHEKNVPVAVNGVAVYPGDVVVADGDGVIVVPQQIAFDVAKYAHQERNNDRIERKKLYGLAGLQPDNSVL